MNDDGHTSNIRDKILTINVKPGWKSGTRITFPNEGDQGPNNIPGNRDCRTNFREKKYTYDILRCGGSRVLYCRTV